MRYLELFAGIGIGSYSLNKIYGKEAVCVGFSEIHKPVLAVYNSHYNHQPLGSIEGLKVMGNLDLIIGGSPCQDLSIQRTSREGLKGAKSRLFYEFLRLVKEHPESAFLLENVASMSAKDRDIISEELGVQPVKLDSSWFGYQKRNRYYWASFPIPLPVDRNGLHEYELIRHSSSGRGKGKPRDERSYRDGKANTLLKGRGCAGQSTCTLWDGEIMTPEQCEHLMGLPEGYTAGVSDNERYKGIGNSFDAFTMNYIIQQLKDYQGE